MAGCAAVAALACMAAPAFAERIVVVTAGDSPAFVQAIAGMREDSGWSVETHDADEPATLLAPVLSDAPSGTAIVALGARAAGVVAQVAPTVPSVDCMVSGDPPVSANAAVVPLAVPIDVHVRWLQRLLPAARKIAIVFDPAQNARTVAAAAGALETAGYSVLREPVASAADLPAALGKLGDADVLLAIPDSTVYVPQLAHGLLLFTYRTQTPMVAFADSWVRAGALYALEWDYAELGRYCATLALARASQTPMAAPALPQPRVSVNRRAAQILRLKWDAATLAGVDSVHD
jgi:putative tryptophan/tyrosine transport system substrate-binding protein